MQEKYRIEISNKAKEDLKRIVLYIKNELKEPVVAKRYAELIKKEILGLQYLPQKYSIIDNILIKDFGVRKLIVKNYIIW